MDQLELFTPKSAKQLPVDCEHEGGFHSNAHVPSGMFCTCCNMIVSRDMPPLKNEPEEIGYISASWAWKYKYGKEWTSDGV